MGLAGAVLVVAGAGIVAARGVRQNAEAPLPTGKFMTPGGAQTEVGSFPANMALSPDGKWIAVTDTGFRQMLSVLDATTGRTVSQIAVGEGEGRNRPALYVGLAFGPTGADGSTLLYASRGPEDRVAIYDIRADGKLTEMGRSLADPSGLYTEAKSTRPNFLAGLALSADGSRCYAVHNETSAYTDYKGSVSVLDTASGRVLGKCTTAAFPLRRRGPDAGAERRPHALRRERAGRSGLRVGCAEAGGSPARP